MKIAVNKYCCDCDEPKTTDRFPLRCKLWPAWVFFYVPGLDDVPLVFLIKLMGFRNVLYCLCSGQSPMVYSENSQSQWLEVILQC